MARVCNVSNFLLCTSADSDAGDRDRFRIMPNINSTAHREQKPYFMRLDEHEMHFETHLIIADANGIRTTASRDKLGRKHRDTAVAAEIRTAASRDKLGRKHRDGGGGGDGGFSILCAHTHMKIELANSA